jgi:hypothetical protein
VYFTEREVFLKVFLGHGDDPFTQLLAHLTYGNVLASGDSNSYRDLGNSLP